LEEGMSEYSPPQPPIYPPPTGPPLLTQGAPRRPWYRRRWAITAIALGVLLVGVGIGSASGGTKTKNVAGPTVHSTATSTITAWDVQKVTTTPTKVIATHTQTVRVTYTPPVKVAFSDGTYRVGSEIKAGTYHTDGGDCYWERDRNSSDPLNKIIDNDNITGPTTIDISGSDYAFNTTGGCDWSRVG